MILLVLAGPFSQSMNARFDYEKPNCPLLKYNYICPLAKYNIEVAEDLMNTVRELLEVVKEQGFDTSEVEGMLTEAEALLKSAKTFSQSCITSNTLATQCQNLLKKCQEMLVSKEEYAVYSALIKAKYTEGLYYDGDKYVSGPVQIYVIMDHTSLFGSGDMDGTLKLIHEKMPATEQETLNDLRIKNIKEHPLADLFYLDVEVVLLSKGESKDWPEFYQMYPFSQGIMILSRVGFNSGMNQALVYVGNQREMVDGEGYYVLLVKEAGVWKIQDEFEAWTS